MIPYYFMFRCIVVLVSIFCLSRVCAWGGVELFFTNLTVSPIHVGNTHPLTDCIPLFSTRKNHEAW